ncbi:MAG TPA: methyltransferase domain-containing protein [Caulobacteraceae bacterium]|nr:methyltransferase domain-containing protein [Caulobacteraceae bacterium]
MKGYGPETFGQLNAEHYDGEYDSPRNVETLAAVQTLFDLAAGGPVLEFAIGTGRIALPLAARGLPVSGIEASPEMVAKLREKPGGAAIPVVIGDMAEARAEGAFDLVFLVFNTLFNLTSQAAQVSCFRNAARHTPNAASSSSRPSCLRSPPMRTASGRERCTWRWTSWWSRRRCTTPSHRPSTTSTSRPRRGECA